MKMTVRSIPLLCAFTLLGCGYLRSLTAHSTPVQNDESILFPQFFEQAPVEVGVRGEPFELDGEMLRALTLASNDYISEEREDAPCQSKKEAQFYRVIRQGNVIFVYIHENFALCGRQYPARHSGARYAISTEGRILRRLIGDMPERPLETPRTEDAGWSEAEPGVSSVFGSTMTPSPDAGTGFDGVLVGP
jgi:hypothetical protein